MDLHWSLPEATAMGQMEAQWWELWVQGEIHQANERLGMDMAVELGQMGVGLALVSEGTRFRRVQATAEQILWQVPRHRPSQHQP